jgi:hypothetical protein
MSNEMAVLDLKNVLIFNKDAMDVIDSTPLFNQNEKMELMNATENMERAFQHSQVFRTPTEMRISVLNDLKFPTPASKYYQSLREMNVHQCELVGLLYDYEQKKEDMKIIQAEAMEIQEQLENDNLKEYERIKLEAKLNKKSIEIRKENFNLKTLKRVADGRKEEIKNWNRILDELRPILEHANIPTDNVDAHQKVSYCIRFIRQAMNSLGSNAQMSGAEINNLLGQLGTTMKVVVEEGLINAVAGYLSNNEKGFLISNRLIPPGIIDDPKKLIKDKEAV